MTTIIPPPKETAIIGRVKYRNVTTRNLKNGDYTVDADREDIRNHFKMSLVTG
jgi:hypothetical protein